ncbi:MAG TPA: DUF4249 domain-containing protein [Flavobacterium sp.]|nr:DUF4249 domain-containing protein [Flavobacterium sp.]
MITKTLYQKFLLLIPVMLLAGCVEPYQLQTNNFEQAIVIEATITNELKNQEIKISKTYRLEENGPTFETGAHVYLTDDQGTNYEFEEQSDKYVSVVPFQAIAGKRYLLNVVLSDGKTYQSAPEVLTATNQIESIMPAVITNNEGERGVQFGVSSFDPTGNSKYYRYEYEETYKIIAPYWKAVDLIYNMVTNQFEFVVKQTESRTCYSTKLSNDILITATSGLSEDRITNFPVRFISTQDPIISYRYSVLVKQYIQNLESYTYYKTLRELSGSESLLSQNQPGFFYGNIKNVDNPAEKVIGFFDVASVSKQRIFFNYTDLFPDEPLPPYFYDCDLYQYDVALDDPRTALIAALANHQLFYYQNEGTVYSMVLPGCGDCTSFSSNVIPDFWED